MKYLRKFESISAYNTFADSAEYVEPNTSLVTGEGVKYNKERHDYSQDYLTLEILSGGSLSFNNDEVYSSINDGEWIRQISFTQNVSEGDIVRLKGNNVQVSSGSFISCSEGTRFNVYGNPLSLWEGDNFAGITSLEEYGEYSGAFGYLFPNGVVSAKNLSLHFTTLGYACYAYMFYGCTSLTEAPSLPATTLASNCYENMFNGCTSLTTPPALPATTLANECYGYMFEDCTSLTTAPELPATTLEMSCYSNMFRGCTSLTTAPELLATTLANYCYYGMFQGCTSLNYIKCLATDISAENCTANWAYNVASSGTFVKNPLMPVYDPDWEDYPEQYWSFCTDGIPEGWTVQDAS